MVKLYVHFERGSDENAQLVIDTIIENKLNGVTAEFSNSPLCIAACLRGRKSDLLKLQEVFEQYGKKVEFID